MNSNKLWHFIKWNFSGIQPFTKRMFLYIVIGLGFEAFVISGGFLVSALLMTIDMAIDIAKLKYDNYCAEQQELLDALNGNKDNQ